ncbi:HlyD family efflux transporter periplasmic adaptor subunit [Rheinheimera sp. 1928-s]|uniref:efflux RND transporter periplasmic adaptor subunit n=1 Tax=Rheinheimera sp. 1928-s TaxID=3033803 RepID=UPI00261FDBAD|nr:HlyD family efflux transporter periplasmic adaptor subunit [Rheinheimera sp. 1928-s]MDF3126804.1 HlyD family efflux transporter periplasmic adaptor subunit [Rheinheimera sp. 1928-s]
MKIADTSSQDERLAPKKTTKKFWVAGSVSLLLVLLLWQIIPAARSWSQSDMSVSLSRVRLDTVRTADFTRDISAQGQVVAAVSPKLYAPAEGTISLLLDAGTEVKQGDVLAIIDSPELNNKLLQEQATFYSLQTSHDRQKILAKKQQLTDKKAVDIAQVTLTTAEREKRRADQGFDKGVISKIEHEKAQDDLETAKLQHQHAVEDARLNKENLDFEVQSLAQQLDRQRLLVEDFQRQVNGLQVLSPVDGLLGNLAVENKTYITKNQLILSVVDLSQFEVEIAVPESYANDLIIGLPVEVTAEQKLYMGKLVTISPEVFENQVKGRVRFTKEAPPALRQNQRLSSRILLEHREGVMQVARGQFLDSSNGKFAYKVANGMAIKTPIELGARSLNSVEILAGLQPGDQIITSGTDIFDGASTVQLNN